MENSKVYMALKKELLEKGETQESIAEAVNLQNGNLWGKIKNGTVKTSFLVSICDELDVELVILSKDGLREYLLTKD